MDHDGGYHLLFSHPKMVADFLSGFVTESWVNDLDLATLERVNAKFHADGLDRRDGDVIWKVRRRDGGDAYLFLVIEFQSSVDPWMALRVSVYVLLLYLHLIRENKLGPDGLLPPVYPVVIYNGDRQWTAKTDLRDLIGRGPDGRPWPWRPRFRYHVLDEQRHDPDRLQGMDNLVAVLVLMERCRTVEELRGLVDRTEALLDNQAYASLRRAFATMLKTVLAPARGIDLGAGDVGGLSEVRDMLAERVKEWTREWKAEGKVEGKAEGKAEGKVEMLLRQLQRRFKTLPSETEGRVRTAGSDQLDEWSDRFVDARTLDDIFGVESRH
jgi:hypothetical protein